MDASWSFRPALLIDSELEEVWGGLLFCCVQLTIRCYQFKLCAARKGGGGWGGGGCGGLRLRVAHIFQEKGAESPTPTSLCSAEAARGRRFKRHGGSLSQTQQPLKPQCLTEDLLESLPASFLLSRSLSFLLSLEDIAAEADLWTSAPVPGLPPAGALGFIASPPPHPPVFFPRRQDFIYNKGVIYGDVKSLTTL